MRKISKSTAGAMRNAQAYYRPGGGGNNAQRVYTSAVKRARSAGYGQMSSHKIGMSSIGLS